MRQRDKKVNKKIKKKKVKSKHRSSEYAIRRHKTPTEFEYLQYNHTWGQRSTRRKFDSREEAERRAKAYQNVGVHARVVPYGENDE